MTGLLAVAVGAALGSPARYLLDRYVQRRHDMTFPWGTLLVNLTGSMLLGVLTGLSLRHALGPTVGLLLATGFCGGYTTFATFTVETIELVREGAYGPALANVGLSLGVGLLGAVVGLQAVLAM